MSFPKKFSHNRMPIEFRQHRDIEQANPVMAVPDGTWPSKWLTGRLEAGC